MSTIINIVFTLLAGFNLLYFGRMYLRGKEAIRQRNKFKEYVGEYQLELAYTTTAGVNVYAYKNPMRLPANRALAAEIASNQARMNITSETLTEFINKAEEAANRGEIVEAFKYLARIKDRQQWACEEQTLLNLADCYLVIEGENPEVNEERYREQKRKIIESDLGAKGFFLAYALRRTNDYSNISEADILSYLTQKRASESLGVV